MKLLLLLYATISTNILFAEDTPKSKMALKIWNEYNIEKNPQTLLFDDLASNLGCPTIMVLRGGGTVEYFWYFKDQIHSFWIMVEDGEVIHIHYDYRVCDEKSSGFHYLIDKNSPNSVYLRNKENIIAIDPVVILHWSQFGENKNDGKQPFQFDLEKR